MTDTEETTITTLEGQHSAMMICYKESLQNLEKFTGDETRKVSKFINSIERIGRMIEANGEILYHMCTAKLVGEARSWYEDNLPLAEWSDLKTALVARFEPTLSSSKIFEQLQERKQQSDETVTSYHDAVIKLCREYDPSMSQKMMVSWLENGIQSSIKTQIKRQMKLLSESARTTQAFLKIAKDEQELQRDNTPQYEETPTYSSYFKTTVSATLPQAEKHVSDSLPSYSRQYVPSHTFNKTHSQNKPFATPQSTTSNSNFIPRKPQTASAWSRSQYPNHEDQRTRTNSKATQDVRTENSRRFDPCLICQRTSHRTIDCHYKQPNGCFKCGQPDHQVRDCPTVFQ